MTFPCENCLCLPICKNEKSIIRLLYKCDDLRNHLASSDSIDKIASVLTSYTIILHNQELAIELARFLKSIKCLKDTNFLSGKEV